MVDLARLVGECQIGLQQSALTLARQTALEERARDFA